jgi:hypothetical protein
MNYYFGIFFTVLFAFSCANQTVHKKNQKSKYVRSDWQHWSDKDGDCLDTRAQILRDRSLSPVWMNKKGCKVKSGKWKDYYYPEFHVLASKVDIDHLIPLKHAHDVGASGWSHSQKEKFANDPENLVITNLRYNRQKGAKGIDEWLPRHKEYACKYISDWVKIKKKYSLKLRQEEYNSIASFKGECDLK